MWIAGLLAGAGIGAGLVLGVAAWVGWSPAWSPRRWADRFRLGRRGWASLGVAFAAGVLTRWPVAMVAAGVLTWLWPSLVGASRENRAQLMRLEALTTWTESLRDTIAAAVGLEQAIIATAENAPLPIADELRRLVGRLRARVALSRALGQFAEELDDASADLIVATLVMNAQLRGRGAVATLSKLVGAARKELEIRTRVEQARTTLRRDARIIVGVTLAFTGGIAVLSPEYFAPYASVGGQTMLMVVIAVFAGGFWWIRAASRIEQPPRFLVAERGPLAPDGAVT